MTKKMFFVQNNFLHQVQILYEAVHFGKTAKLLYSCFKANLDSMELINCSQTKFVAICLAGLF